MYRSFRTSQSLVYNPPLLFSSFSIFPFLLLLLPSLFPSSSRHIFCSYRLLGFVSFLCFPSLPNATPLPQCLIFLGLFFVLFCLCILSLDMSSQILSLDFDSKSSYLDPMDAAFPYMENGLDYLQYPPQSPPPPAFDLPVGCKSSFQALINCLICIIKCLPLPPPLLSMVHWRFQVITLTPLNSTHHLPSARILLLRPTA